MVCFNVYIYATSESTTCQPGYRMRISRPEEIFVTKLSILHRVLTILAIEENKNNLFTTKGIY